LYIGVSCVFSLLLIHPPFAFSADYIGAQAVLEKISQKPQSNSGGQLSASAQLKRDIESFKKQSATLAPEEAAKQWLKLLDRQLNLSPLEMQQIYENPGAAVIFNPNDVWYALPSPAAWDALRKAVESRTESKDHPEHELGLRLIVHTLVSDQQAQTNDLAQLVTVASRMSEDESPRLLEAVAEIRQGLLATSSDPELVLKSLNEQLESGNLSGQFSIPNLVPLVGEQKTAEFFRHVFSTASVGVSIEQGEATKKVARQVALEMVDQLKTPQWALACSLDAGPLFEGMEKKFASATMVTNLSSPDAALALLANTRKRFDSNERVHAQARVYYLLSLISQNRTKEAAALAQKLSHEDSIMVPEEALEPVLHFFRRKICTL